MPYSLIVHSKLVWGIKHWCTVNLKSLEIAHDKEEQLKSSGIDRFSMIFNSKKKVYRNQKKTEKSEKFCS